MGACCEPSSKKEPAISDMTVNLGRMDVKTRPSTTTFTNHLNEDSEKKAKEWQKKCRDIFVSMDLDGSNSLCASEISSAFVRLGLKCKDATALLNEADLDNSGDLSLEEFTMLVSRLLEVKEGSALGILNEYEKWKVFFQKNHLNLPNMSNIGVNNLPQKEIGDVGYDEFWGKLWEKVTLKDMPLNFQRGVGWIDVAFRIGDPEKT